MHPIDQNRTVFQEDIATTAGGTQLISSPCRVFSIIVSCETTAAGTVSFSNSTGTYAVASRVGKVSLNGVDTKTITYPTGKFFSAGLCAIANKASMDVEVVYE